MIARARSPLARTLVVPRFPQPQWLGVGYPVVPSRPLRTQGLRRPRAPPCPKTRLWGGSPGDCRRRSSCAPRALRVCWTVGSCCAAASSASAVGSAAIATRLGLGRVVAAAATLGSVAPAYVARPALLDVLFEALEVGKGDLILEVDIGLEHAGRAGLLLQLEMTAVSLDCLVSFGMFPEEDVMVGASLDVLEAFLKLVFNVDEAIDCNVVRVEVVEEGVGALEGGLDAASESLQTRQLGLLSRAEHSLGFSRVVINVALPPRRDAFCC